MASSYEARVRKLLPLAGITVNGKNPWDIQVYDERFYKRVLGEGSLGLGESYMDGWWDAEQLDEFFLRLLGTDLDQAVRGSADLIMIVALARLFNLQSKSRAFAVGEKHYDIGNDLFAFMLDKRLTYTCGYWKDAKNLDEAQEAKLDLVCKKIGLKKGHTVLDIGCGWGSFAKFAAERYGAIVTGITISQEQIALGEELCAGLPVTFKLQDYRDATGQYDRVVSLGMYEHVGYKNYSAFMEVAARCLKDDGIFLLHTIGENVSVVAADAWFNKYIFPNGMLPSIQQIGKAIERVFVMEDWHNFGADYDKTLMAWWNNINVHWKDLPPQYDERFRRMWKYYLLSLAGLFRARRAQLWQIVLTKKGTPGGYRSVR